MNLGRRYSVRGETVYTEAQVQMRIQHALAHQVAQGPSKREMYLLTLGQLGITELNSASTPSSNWSKEGEPDFHPDLIDKERGSLMLGNHTDDELANAVFMHGDEGGEASMRRVMAGGISTIAYLTAGKERIRWLSRHLEKALKKVQELEETIQDMHDDAREADERRDD